MKVLGIVAEYNPFHNGHAYHIARSRQKTGATHVVAVMSGNFVQRGEPACMLKWIRARAAVEGGADLVIELPLPFATATAQRFALGAVSLLDALGCVDVLSFGSECGELEPLLKIAGELSAPLGETFHMASAKGLSFASAREADLAERLGDSVLSLLKGPNNILAIEYLKALSDLESEISPFTILRKGAGYHETDEKGAFISATQARLLMQKSDISGLRQALPAPSMELALSEISNGRAPASMANAERAVLARLRGMTESDWLSLPDMGEGLESRFLKSVRLCTSLSELMESVKTRRYPMSRIRRLILHAFLGVRAADINTPPAYIRVLALNTMGMQLLRRIDEEGCLPVLTKPSHISRLPKAAQNAFSLEARSTDLYGLFTPSVLPCALDWIIGPAVIKEN